MVRWWWFCVLGKHLSPPPAREMCVYVEVKGTVVCGNYGKLGGMGTTYTITLIWKSGWVAALK